MSAISRLTITNYQTQSGFLLKKLPLTYQVFGKELGTAPVVLVTHALTGNSNVCGEKGWWKDLIGAKKCIDSSQYTILTFNIPGNGFDGFLLDNYEDVTVYDVAQWFLSGLEQLKIPSVFAAIGGSLGGSILWQMAVLKPNLFQNLIPIATDWKATDWLIAQCRVQTQILNNSEKPVYDARVHAMTFYRTPQSFKQKFNRDFKTDEDIFSVESWLLYHGATLEKRFQLQAYKLMNHLLTTANIETNEANFNTLASKIEGNIHLVGIDSDGFYLNEEIKETYFALKPIKNNVHIAEINSIHGHDAFLIEYEQLAGILNPIFNSEKTTKKKTMSTQVLDNPVLNRIDLNNIKKKKVNIAIFGHGNVGSHLVNQIISTKDEISRRRDLVLNIFAIANSKTVLLQQNGLGENWLEEKAKTGEKYNPQDVIAFAKTNNLQNLILVDNTADSDFVQNYTTFVENGFHLVSSNKIANTLDLGFYQNLREKLTSKKRAYLYETNVGAGLPLIDTIKLLHLSGENITRIRGVFSGSLSYIFNTFSEEDRSFSSVLHSAIDKGFTEPDPREDLCGNDVGRKLLILARELDLHNEFSDISIQNLIPKDLRNVSKTEFLERLKELDVPFQIKKKNQPTDSVFRYVADLHGDLSKETGAILTVNLASVQKNSMLGALKGSDSIFEIYTESYGDNPIVIQGAGAGAAVTARGVFGDILRISDKEN